MALLLSTLAVLLLVPLAPTSTRAASASTDTISAGQVLAADGTLVSNNSKFVLGFFQGESPAKWYLGIWFSAVPNRTTVWVADGATPVMEDAGFGATPQLSISDNGSLAVSNKATNSITWSTHNAQPQLPANNTNNTLAVLLDTGNLVLQDTSGSGSGSEPRVLWQSFDYPTDTLLPSARLGRNKATGLNRRLVSRKSLAGPTPGRYCYEVDPDTPQMVLKLCGSSVVYWSTGPWNGRAFSGIPELTGDSPNFHLAFVDNSREEYLQYNVTVEVVTRNMLDVTGQNIHQVWRDNAQGQGWQTLYAAPKSPCDVYGICGPFALCDYDLLPVCVCMKGFSVRSLRDWEQGDRTGGCVRDTPLNCNSSRTAGAASSDDKFYSSMASVTLPEKSRSIQAARSLAECSEACLNNCSCTAYSYGGLGCLVWQDELLNAKSNAVSANGGGILYLRLAASEIPLPSTGRSSKTGLIVGIVLGASAALVLVFVALMMWRHKTKASVQGGGLVAFRYKDLRSASKNFSEKLGQGGFGSVFKGQLRDSTSIAVKRLDGSFQGDKQFRAEVSSIGIIQHINLVKLVGFCCDGDTRFLVYEHMPKRSLDIHLFSQSGGTLLNWSTRYQIALGVARGLSYLHEGCRDCIIHCDIKPQNILLDTVFRPKIADFGMAKLVGRDFSRVLTTMRGTLGYLAPEWISGTPITAKVDVYSYGMVLLELVSGRRNTDEEYTATDGSHVVYFPMQASKKLLEGDVMSLLDQRLGGDANLKEVQRVCKVACWCIQDDEAQRPTMGQVVQILEGVLDREMPPLPRLIQTIFAKPRSANFSAETV